MGTGFDFIVESTTSDNAVDVAGTVAIFADRLAAITRNQLLGFETKTVVGVPTLTAFTAVFICEQVVFIGWALGAIRPTFRIHSIHDILLTIIPTTIYSSLKSSRFDSADFYF
jgi:hypothetical protein